MRLFALAVASAAAATSLCGASNIEPPPLLLHDHVSIVASRRNDTCCHASAHLQEVLSLSELPLDRLLRVRIAMHPSMSREQHEDDEETSLENDEEGEALPQPEALRSRHRMRRPPVQRGDVIETGSGQSLGTKQSKLATGFQLAITVLSFLAFGAYLISLVVSIVRNNNSSTTTGTNTTQQPFVLVPATAGKRKRRRAVPPWLPPQLPEPEHVFSAITAVAKAYARYEGHELDG